jgi:integrase
MSKSDRVPSYRRHKQSGQAIVTLTDGLGGRRDILLGKYRSKESRVEYARVIAEWETAGRVLPSLTKATADLNVNELILRFWKHAEQHYRRPPGTATSELSEYRRAFRVLKELYGHTLAKDFGPLALKTVRQRMIDSGLARGVINQRIGRIRRMFKWGVENELVSAPILQALQAVRGLVRGRSTAKETAPVGPVAVALVEDTLPHLTRQVRGMVKVQLLTGARPGEVCIMRACDIDMSGPVWLYYPGRDQGPAGQHKTAHHGYRRVIAIGPRAQEVIREFLKPDLQAYLFSPKEARAESDAERRQQRKSPMTPSQAKRRRKRKPRKQPGDRYTVNSISHAIRAACLKAGLPPWHAHQLRHTKATEIRREAGLDAARAVLGHRSPAITEVYAEIDVGKAAEVMERLG